MNQCDHAYAKVRFDRASIDWFSQNLHLVACPETRAEIWRYFWVLVREERQMSSIEFLEFAQRQLQYETVE